jgi:transposase
MRRIQIHLSKSDLKTIEALRSKGLHSSREISRAHILAALDYQLSDEQIGAVLGVSRKVIWRTLSAYREKGLDYALRDARRSGAPRKYRPDQAQAEVAAVACSQPPPGAKRWTVKLLTEAVGQREGLAGINRESVRQLLKKTS